jgi:uncharacterized Zn-finger protein
MKSNDLQNAIALFPIIPVPGRLPENGSAVSRRRVAGAVRRTILPETIMTDTQTVEVTARDLPLQCPPADAAAWSQHPRVFLEVARAGEALCPYCRTRYVFKGEPPKGH